MVQYKNYQETHTFILMMRFFLAQKLLLISFLVFILGNVYLYNFILEYHSVIHFNSYNYKFNAHHFLKDSRINNGPFSFLRAMGQYDAQWYLKTASIGYPKQRTIDDIKNKLIMGGLNYAFFPFYPLVLRLFNTYIKNIELSAFLLSNILLIVDFFSLYYVVSKLYGKKIGIKTCFLLFFFPFSIFYRSYYTEGLYLSLLIWFGYFWIRKKYILAAVFLSFLNITKGNEILLNLVFILYLLKEVKRKKYAIWRAEVVGAIQILPFLIWALFVYIQTGFLFYFYTAQHAWIQSEKLPPFLYNLAIISFFPKLPLHYFNSSKIDVVMIVITAFLLFKSRKYLRPELWWISFLLYSTQLVIIHTMSFSRYQSVSFPLFIYIASRFNTKYFLCVAFLFYVGLLIVSIFFVNWYWIG